MRHSGLFVLLAFLLYPILSIAQTPEAGAAAPAAQTLVTPAVVWEKIVALRRLTVNGIIPDLEVRGLATDFTQEQKMRVARELMISDKFSDIQMAKISDVMALLDCLNGHPIAKAKIKPECVKNGKIDAMMAHAGKLMSLEDRMIRQAVEKQQ